MAEYAIKAKNFVLPGELAQDGYLLISDGKFAGYQKDKPSCEVKDYGDAWVAPGLMDTHIHGFLGHDVMDNDWDGVQEMAHGLLKYGVTSWLPTTLTASFEQLKDVCKTIGDNASKNTGSRIQGIFFEGPFFTEPHKGAQNPAYFSDPSIEKLEAWQEAAGGLVKKIAIAPERKGAADFCAAATEQGVTVSIGHSDASYEEAALCVDYGATIVNHTYNGMSLLVHRQPGMVGAAFATRNTYLEAICDGHHNHPAAVKVLINSRGWENTVLITDCMCAGGMPDGDYKLGEFPVHVEAGAARLKNAERSLAGSILTLDVAVKNVYDWGLVTAEEALRMASENPAKSVGLTSCGFILPRRNADFIVLDKDLNLIETYLGGKSVYKK